MSDLFHHSICDGLMGNYVKNIIFILIMFNIRFYILSAILEPMTSPWAKLTTIDAKAILML